MGWGREIRLDAIQAYGQGKRLVRVMKYAWMQVRVRVRRHALSGQVSCGLGRVRVIACLIPERVMPRRAGLGYSCIECPKAHAT